jgi:Fic-DOC domain mobile mystery protein B
MGLEIEYMEGQTPLDDDEKEGLKIPTVITRGELDEFEQQNIEQAIIWSIKRKFRAEDILTEKFVKEVHRKMFAEVWSWAGEFRITNKNLGVDKWEIGTELKKLLDDTVYWISHQTYPADQIALRCKHRMVSIHCFANGNGRHSRLMADIIISHVFKQPLFSWGTKYANMPGESRNEYLKAIRLADKGNYLPLLDFARG